MEKLILLGRATRDAEKITSKNGKDFAKFSVAVNRYMGKEAGTQVSFYDCIVFAAKQVDRVVEKIKKGDLVTLDGRPQAEPYLSKDGEAKAAMTVIVNGWSLLKH